MRKRRVGVYQCIGHVFNAWTLEGVASPVRKCERCDYRQTRVEYFFIRKKKVYLAKVKLEIAERTKHIDLFWW